MKQAFTISMIIKLSILIFICATALTCMGCSNVGTVAVPPAVVTKDVDHTIVFKSENFIYKNDQVAFNGKRLYFIHGCLTCDHNTGLMDTPAYADLVTNLNNAGWQVVEFDLPIYDREYWTDGGAEYSQKFSQKLELAVLWADQNYGPASVNVVGGISYGSLHALMAPTLSNRFSGYFGVLCLVPLSNLTEYEGLNVPMFDPTKANSIYSLSHLKGYLVWNTTDDRVGYHEAENLYNSLSLAGASVQNHIYNHGEHTIDGDNLNYIYDWMINNF